MHFRTLSLTLGLCCASLFAAEKGQLDASNALFTVLAAANAAGYDGGLASSPPLRTQVRDRIAATKAPVIDELKAWYAAHPQRSKTDDLSRFISLGLSVKDAPGFEWIKREVEVPPDALAMNGFRELLPRFYTEANIADLWRDSQPAVERALEIYQEPVAQAILQANGYLRNSTSGYLGRRFQIFLDFLGAPNQVQTRSFGDDYFVVVTPSAEPRTFEIRHAYLRYLLDPLAIKYGMELKEKASLLQIAAPAPLLRDAFKEDFGLLATECLIKAIESRLLQNPGLGKQAVREGYILTPYFEGQLAIFETQPDSMRLFFPIMVRRIDEQKEAKRLEGVQFATSLPPVNGTGGSGTAAIAATASQAAQTVRKAEDFYDRNDLENARKLYAQSLEQPGSATDHSLGYYGLAHVALLQNDAERANQLFHKTLDSSPEHDIQAWSCYYLGKLSAVAHEPEEAAKWFNQALAVPGATPKAIEASKRELREIAVPPVK